MSPIRRRRRPPPADFAALRAFARAYLHEDFAREYGSAVQAAHAFAAAASAAERDDLAAELTRLAALGWPPDRLRAFFTDTLGAAWAAPSADAVLQMADAVAERRERGR